MDWELRLEDAMSGPAARMAAALKPVEDKLRDVNKQLASSAIDKMTDGLEKQRAQLRLQRSDLAQNLRAARAQERAEAQMDRAASRARSVAAREERLRARAAESQARIEQRARASADRYFQRSAQERQRLDAQVRARQARALASSARQEQAAQRAAARVSAREQQRSMRQAQAAQRRASMAAEKVSSQNAKNWESDGGMSIPLAAGQAGVLLKVAAAAAAAAVAVGALGVAFSKSVLSAVDFRRGTLGALEILLKSKEKAREAMDVGVKMALKFNMDPQEAISGIHEMIGKGFNAKDSGIVLTALADLKVLSPKANIEKALLAITQIKGKPKLGMEELNQQLADAGLETAKVIDQLALKLGKGRAEIYKMITAGKITGEQGIEAIIAAITKMGTGNLGEAAEQAAQKSLGGLLNGIRTRLQFIPLEIAKALDNSAGIEAVMQAMRTLMAGVDPTKSAGMKQLLGSAGRFADELFKQLFGAAGDKSAGSTIQKILVRSAEIVDTLTEGLKIVGPIVKEALGGFGEGFGEAYDVIREIGGSLLEAFGGDRQAAINGAAKAARVMGKIMGYLVVGLGLAAGGVMFLIETFAALAFAVLSSGAIVVAAVSAWWDEIKATGSSLMDAGMSLGTNLWAGFVQGIESGIARVTDAASRLANAAKSAVGNALTIQSPSRVMMEMGGYTAEGFAQGVDDGAGQVDASMRDLVAPPAPVLGQGGASTSSTSTFSVGGITVIVQTNGNGSDPKALGAAVGSEVVQALENLIVQMGLSPTPA